MLNKNTWGIKKCKAKKNQRLKALILARAKKFIATVANYLLQTFTIKAHNNLQGVFPTMIGFVTIGHLSCIISCKQKVAKDDKANYGWENTM